MESKIIDKYTIYSNGDVYGLKGKKLKPNLHHSGYLYLNLKKDNKRWNISLHRLLAMAFISGFDDNLQVNHKDGNKLNNSLDNLEMVTQQENMKHFYDIIGSEERDKKIRQTLLGIKHTDERKKNRSISQKKLWENEEYRKHMSIAHKK